MSDKKLTPQQAYRERQREKRIDLDAAAKAMLQSMCGFLGVTPSAYVSELVRFDYMRTCEKLRESNYDEYRRLTGLSDRLL